MARTRSAENLKDPATGRPLTPGVEYRGPAQDRARKMVDGKRIKRTFETDKLAKDWLEETSVAVRKGEFVDRTSLGQSTLAQLVERYEATELKVGGRRRGAADDLGHVPAIKRDAIGSLLLSKLTPIAVRGFRDRQLEKYEAGSVVKRLNLLAGILSHAMNEWDVPLSLNVGSAKTVNCPEGADIKRDRRLLPAKPADVGPPSRPDGRRRKKRRTD